MCCEATENALGIRAPRRARLIRSIMLEIERIHSHLLWLGIAGHIIGFDTVLMQAWRIREPVMWLAEYITGNRKTYGMNIVGGVRRDITREKHERILEVMKRVEEETVAVIRAVEGDTMLHVRLRGIGYLSPEDARAMCVVGPTARGSNIAIDARVDHPYAGYDELVPEKKVHDECDIWARTLVRLEETIESVRLVREGIKALQDMPEGEIVLNITEEVPEGLEGISVVEAPRGECIHYVITSAENRPHRWRVRAPSYMNIHALPVMFKNKDGGIPSEPFSRANIADIPIIIGSVDPCFSCTERVEVIDVKKKEVRFYTRSELIELCRLKAQELFNRRSITVGELGGSAKQPMERQH